MNPLNQEHFEASQETINLVRQKEIDKMSEEQKHKFEVVEQAVKLLVDNGIYFYLFPMLYSSTENKELVWLWNSIGQFTKFDNAGSIIKESADKNSIFHACLLSTIFYSLTNNRVNEENRELMDIQRDKWNYFMGYLERCLITASNYRYGDEKSKNDEN